LKRREFIELICGLAATTMIHLKPAFAERQPKLIVWISAFPFAPGRPFATLFLNEMQEQGYVAGRDFAYAERGGHGVPDASRVAKEASQLKPDIIIAPATLEAVAAKKATSTIPIICPALADAAHLGLIASEARPGGNVTGIEPYIGGLPAKQIELAREILPDATRIGLLTNDDDPKGPPQVRDLRAAAQALGLEIVLANADRPEDIEPALQAGERKSRYSNRASDHHVADQPITDSDVGAAEAAPDGLRLSGARRRRWSAMALIFAGASGAPRILRSKSCAVRHPATCRSNFRPACGSLQIRGPQRRLASRSRQCCSPAPTR
jgi:ABC transporter substrate binding protein